MHPALNERLPILLTEIFGENLPQSWLSGGSLLMEELGAPYQGDYDLLVEGSIDELTNVLKRRNVLFFVNVAGTLKVPLASGETIDLRPIGDAQPADVVATLESYHFDIVSAAREIGGKERVISTDARAKSISSRCFGFNETYEPTLQFAAGILTAMAVYKQFLGFSCADPRTLKCAEDYQKILRPSFCQPEDAIRSVYQEIEHFSDLMIQATLCRGIVRRAMKGEISEWDDYDILVPKRTGEAISILEREGIPYSLNHFGMPKVRGRFGRFYDLLCYDASPTETCTSFCMSSDRMFWARGETAPRDLGDYLSRSPPDLFLSAPGDELRLDQEERYYLIKAVFLSVLEGASLEADVLEAIQRSCALGIRDRRSISGLSIELIARGHQGDLAAYLSQFEEAEFGSVVDGYLAFYRNWRAYVGASGDR